MYYRKKEKEGRKGGREGGRKEGRKDGRKEGTKERRNEGTKERRKKRLFTSNSIEFTGQEMGDRLIY